LSLIIRWIVGGGIGCILLTVLILALAYARRPNGLQSEPLPAVETA
jgi:hypothetical protein